MQLYGFKRNDGTIGFRNHVLVFPVTGCLKTVARRIAEGEPAATCLDHPNGCDLHGPDAEVLESILTGFATHPNVGGVLFLNMGCAATLSMKLPDKVKESGRLVRQLGCQTAGTPRLVEKGIGIVTEMVAELASQEREAVPFSALTVGTKCGASDQNSLDHVHPVLGRACDILVENGATVVLSEDCELLGSAHLLSERATSPEIGKKIMAMRDTANEAWRSRFGQSFEERMLGLMSREKWEAASLTSASKAGTTPITGFCELTDRVKGPGLVILDAPNTDLENVTCQAASGCNVVLFSTGRGTPVGSPTSIVLKITATALTYERMIENIDLSVADVMDGNESVDEAAERVIQKLIETVNSSPAKAEALEHWEVAMPIRGVTF